ncbi:MAG: Tripartite-type tricarboxylate transporter, receptor component TctC [Hyphomicrobiales bacterium]|nr:Tripartite-type tricarboxylate transporter, receptor component TctC [Hyphomicrobiales bacterium]
MKGRLALLAAGVAAWFALAGAQQTSAQTADQFYKGRQVTMLVYTAAGSTYDIYARVLARHMGSHIPSEPNFIVQNMPGAGGLKAVDYLYNIAPKDGTVIGTIGRGLPFEPMLGRTDVNFDPYKFTWLGSMNREFSLAISWHTSKVKTLDDLMKQELLIPGTGAGADSQIIPLAINNLVGTKFKIINGYVNTTEAALAMERGELDGVGYWSWSSILSLHPDWVKDKKINLLFHTGMAPSPDLPGVPMIRERAKTALDGKALDFLLAREIIGRPFVAPPSLPPDRAKILRDAFAETMKDPAFLKDAEKTGIDVELVTADEVDALLKKAGAAPAEVTDRVKALLGR